MENYRVRLAGVVEAVASPRRTASGQIKITESLIGLPVDSAVSSILTTAFANALGSYK